MSLDDYQGANRLGRTIIDSRQWVEVWSIDLIRIVIPQIQNTRQLIQHTSFLRCLFQKVKDTHQTGRVITRTDTDVCEVVPFAIILDFQSHQLLVHSVQRLDILTSHCLVL